MLFYVVSAIVQLGCAFFMLMLVIGIPSLFGIAVAAILVVLNGQLARKNRGNNKRGLECADQRISCLRQVLDGIRFIKMSAWENSYFDRLSDLRHSESEHNRRFRTIE